MADVHDQIRDFWDRDSRTYDDSTSHAISDPVEAAAWRAALRRALPEPAVNVLDVGAGTGALSLLAAELGYDVTALDLSEGMLSRARAKAEARGLGMTFVVGPAADPPHTVPMNSPNTDARIRGTVVLRLLSILQLLVARN